MILTFALDDGSPCWPYSFIVDDSGFEWSAFDNHFDDEQSWLFVISEQEH